MMKNVWVYILILGFAFSNGTAQDIIKTGTPYVQQYKKSQYKAGNQNWSIATGSNGRIYVGNTDGLLTFDGNFWQLYTLPNHSTIRSIAISPDDKVYTGGRGEFGYWKRIGINHLRYYSLAHLVDDKTFFLNDEIWKIIIDGQRIFFHTFSKSFIYENGKIKTLMAKGEPFLFPHQVGKSIYFEQLPSGLHEFKNERLLAVKGKDMLKNKNILAILPFQSDISLIATSKDGLYLLYKDGSIKPWPIAANNLLAQSQVNNGIYLYNGQYAFGTIQNGVIIIDREGKVVQHINKNNGLQNNTVLSLSKDQQNNLWVGLDNGIDRVEINAPLSFYSDFEGKIGTVYCSQIYRGRLYLGTNKGLFSSPWHGVESAEPLHFDLISNSSGQVWSLAIFNNELICGHNEGTFVLKDNRLSRISVVTGGWQFTPIFGTSHVLQGNYTGIARFDITPVTRFIEQFNSIKEPVRFIVQADKYHFWIGNQGAIKLIEFDNAYAKATVKYTSETDKTLAARQFTGVFNVENSLLFTTDAGIMTFDNLSKKFTFKHELNNKLGSFDRANKILPFQNGSYWLIKKSQIAMLTFQPNGPLKIDSTSLAPLQDRMMNQYENILALDSNVFLIGLDDGFAIYKANAIQNQSPVPPPLFSQITKTDNGMLLNAEDPIVLEYAENSLRFAFASPFYTASPVEYQYALDGYSEEWSKWDRTTYKEFTNLSPGEYTFKVRARANNGHISEISTVKFTINVPWYRSWWAVLVYLTAVAAMVYLIYKWRLQKEKKRQFQLQRKWLEEKKEALAREAEMNEKELIKRQNQQLEVELQVKNRELANAALNIVYKNEMLNNLHKELTQLKDAEGNRLGNEELKKINKLIDEAHSDDRDWHIFEKSFNESHENFFKKLKAEFPDLVPNDLKLCAYLRLNMSSKEIASLLNISTRGVEIRRYRLRKKLNIPTDKNLSEFLMER